MLEKRRLWAGVLLAVIATVHLALTLIPQDIVSGLGLQAGKLVILAQLDVSASQFGTALPDAYELQSTLFRDIKSLTNTGLMLGAAAVASFHEAPNVPVSSISFQTGITLAVSGFVMEGAARFAFGCNVAAFCSGIGTVGLRGWACFIGAVLGAITRVWLRHILQVRQKQ